jgi:ribosomal protein S14
MRGLCGPICRFWSKVDKNGPVPAHRRELGPCWFWTSAKKDDGYGVMYTREGVVRAARFAWEEANGAIPQGLWVLHHCDNPGCVNPGHLFVGTAGDNMADMVSKGRSQHGEWHYSKLRPDRLPRGDRNGSRKHPERLPRGERVHNAKLNEEKIRLIRECTAFGMTHAEIAFYFKVSRECISEVARGEHWRHVT